MSLVISITSQNCFFSLLPHTARRMVEQSLKFLFCPDQIVPVIGACIRYVLVVDEGLVFHGHEQLAGQLGQGGWRQGAG